MVTGGHGTDVQTVLSNPKRVQSRGEEIANSISHGLGFLVALAATPWLIWTAVQRGSVAAVVGVSVFAATLMLMFMTSTLYHALPHPRIKPILRLLDHNAIFLLIAGTYTPIVLGVLYGPWGWTLFGLVWGLALAGIILKTVSGHRFHGLVVAIYVLMGSRAACSTPAAWRFTARKSCPTRISSGTCSSSPARSATSSRSPATPSDPGC
jgi:hemolysin III